jgi:hypothetical protein
MDAAVSTGLFTLGGVIVGGLVNGGVTYAVERRREGWVAQKDARLFMPRLSRLSFAMGAALDDQWSWDELCVVVEANLDDWEDQYAEVFAGTLPFDDWFTVYKAVRPLQQMTHTAPRNGTRIGPKDAEYLRGLIDNTVAAMMTLTMVAVSGVRRRRVRSALRSLWYRFRRPDEDELLAEAGFDPRELHEDS